MRVYFVVLNEIMTGVIASQVITPAKTYAAAFPDLDIRVVFLEPARVAFGRAARKRLRELRHLWSGGSLKLYPYVGRLGKLAPAISLRTFLRLMGGGADKLVFHCRGPEAVLQARHALRGTGGRVVFDARGASDYEAVLRLTARGRGGDTALLLKSFETSRRRDQQAIEQADAVVAVTETLAEKLAQMVAPEKKVSVIPCCIERTLFSQSDRLQKRSELGLSEDELLFAHVSTEARWEAFQDIFAFFRRVRARRPARLLFLTTLQPEVVTANLAPNDPLRGALLIKSVRPGDVPAYLSAADVGLLLRRPHEAFRVSAPIKFAEYLGAGLIPVVSKGIGTTGEVVESQSLGVVIPSDPSSPELDQYVGQLLALSEGDREGARRRSIEVCERLFLWERYIPVVARLYGLA